LVLEGLELHDRNDRSTASLLVSMVKGGDLRMLNCRLVSGSEAHAVSLTGQGELINTHIGGDVTALRVGHDAGTARIQNSILSALSVGILCDNLAGPATDHRIHLTQSTLVAFRVIQARVYLEGASAKAPPEPVPFTLAGNVLAAIPPSAAVNFNVDWRDAALPSPKELGEQLRLRYNVSEKNNLFSKNKDFARLETLAEKNLELFATLKDWQAVWRMSETKSEEVQPRFQGGDMFDRMRKEPWNLRAADFRLAPGSPGKGAGPGGKDLGADVDLVGPGEAYERWKQTPEYREWRKKTEEVMHSN
jgi:hypothetical protein